MGEGSGRPSSCPAFMASQGYLCGPGCWTTWTSGLSRKGLSYEPKPVSNGTSIARSREDIQKVNVASFMACLFGFLEATGWLLIETDFIPRRASGRSTDILRCKRSSPGVGAEDREAGLTNAEDEDGENSDHLPEPQAPNHHGLRSHRIGFLFRWFSGGLQKELRSRRGEKNEMG